MIPQARQRIHCHNADVVTWASVAKGTRRPPGNRLFQSFSLSSPTFDTHLAAINNPLLDTRKGYLFRNMHFHRQFLCLPLSQDFQEKQSGKPLLNECLRQGVGTALPGQSVWQGRQLLRRSFQDQEARGHEDRPSERTEAGAT